MTHNLTTGPSSVPDRIGAHFSHTTLAQPAQCSFLRLNTPNFFWQTRHTVTCLMSSYTGAGTRSRTKPTPAFVYIIVIEFSKAREREREEAISRKKVNVERGKMEVYRFVTCLTAVWSFFISEDHGTCIIYIYIL